MKELVKNLLEKLGLGVNGYMASPAIFAGMLLKFTNIAFVYECLGTDKYGVSTYEFSSEDVILTYKVSNAHIIKFNVQDK